MPKYTKQLQSRLIEVVKFNVTRSIFNIYNAERKRDAKVDLEQLFFVNQKNVNSSSKFC